jgi:hypothetical protein
VPSTPARNPAHQRPEAPPNLRLWLLYPLFFVAVFLSHWTLLRLPYFWDEGGYYIPAALDFFRTGTLIPHSTITNAHPPLPSILLAAWWRLSGYVISGTRTFICIVSAFALLAVFRLARRLAPSPAPNAAPDLTALAVTLLTASYPVWYAQSTLAHADIFAAAFTLWALSFYLAPQPPPTAPDPGQPAPNSHTQPARTRANLLAIALLFSLAALSKETAIVTPAALAAYEIFRLLRKNASRQDTLPILAALLAPILPLIAWYAFHYHRTGFVFGNPEFLRYNATANLSLHRFALCLYHRILHLTLHMNMFVPVLCAAAASLTPALRPQQPSPLPRRTLLPIAVVLLANLLAFSVLGGALLTRYLLPMYPLILLICVVELRQHLRLWYAVVALSLAAFIAAIHLNPPYAFAPEDNLTYRDMIVLHQQAISLIANHFPQATVLTAWPATTELEHPELGYTRHPIHTVSLPNFSLAQIQDANIPPSSFDTALLFSTKWEPPPGQTNLGKQNEAADTRYFDFHHDLQPAEAANLLHGQIIWERHLRGEWAAVLRFNRTPPASHP